MDGNLISKNLQRFINFECRDQIWEYGFYKFSNLLQSFGIEMSLHESERVKRCLTISSLKKNEALKCAIYEENLIFIINGGLKSFDGNYSVDALLGADSLFVCSTNAIESMFKFSNLSACVTTYFFIANTKKIASAIGNEAWNSLLVKSLVRINKNYQHLFRLMTLPARDRIDMARLSFPEIFETFNSKTIALLLKIAPETFSRAGSSKL